MNNYRPLRILISGGGTGGHIFPAVSIADEMRRLNPDSEILFVGAEGKMEMEKVPAAGYRIVGLPVVGLPGVPRPEARQSCSPLPELSPAPSSHPPLSPAFRYPD